ncbi:MAG: DUF1015 domain-containing protein [Deltaproteobacteria bacterium]|nr:DUF1015 domain-containing protein [Deltaproteobacteria bacterium]
MTVVRPFRALRYDADRLDLSRVIAPPYDVIAADERASFFDRDPHNAIRFELTRDVGEEAATDYGWIRETIDAWRDTGVLIRDVEPGYYVMRQSYKAPSGEMFERVGFFAELALEGYDSRIVRPHERTLAGPRADRLKLLRAAEANLSSVFLLYEDREDELGAILDAALTSSVLGRATDAAGVDSVLARLTEPGSILAIRRFMQERPTVIADGHHRYETALEYRRQQIQALGDDPTAAWQSTIAYFANAYSAGSLLLPIHRVVLEVPAPSEDAWRSSLPGWEIVRLAAANPDSIEAALARNLAPLAEQPAFVAESDDGTLLLIRRNEVLAPRLMVRILEEEILRAVFGLDAEAIRGGAVSFPKSARRAAEEIRSGRGKVALYLNPMSPDDVFRTTGEGEVMPQKSTFFYPKIPTGMVFRDHRDLAAPSDQR